MKFHTFFLLLLLIGTACISDKEAYMESKVIDSVVAIDFDKAKWQIQDGKDYPHREQLYTEILYSGEVRTLNKKGILNLLGEPSYYRDDPNYLHYIIKQRRLGAWILHTKALVIKMEDDQTVEWIKLYE